MKVPSRSDLGLIRWGRSHLWAVFFPDAPAPFNEWFPASDVEEGLGSIETDVLKIGSNKIELPTGADVKNIKITFFDSEEQAILQWLKTWYDNIVHGATVAALNSILLPVQIAYLDSLLDPIRINSYQVFPKDPLFFTGSNSSAPLSNAITFVIAEDLTNDEQSDDQGVVRGNVTHGMSLLRSANPAPTPIKFF